MDKKETLSLILQGLYKDHKEIEEFLKNYFKIIVGGPETIKNLGFKVTPCYFRGNLYIPSYEPVYGKCREIINFIQSVDINEDIIVPITIHWAWEVENNFNDVKKIM